MPAPSPVTSNSRSSDGRSSTPGPSVDPHRSACYLRRAWKGVRILSGKPEAARGGRRIELRHIHSAAASGRPRLLIVDDDPALLSVLEVSLSERYDVVVSPDPLHALELVQDRSFDVYLYDILMEALPGIELLMLTLARAPHAPVVLMTGDPTVERTVEALRAGATDLVLKPLDLADLPERLERALARSRARGPLATERMEAVHEALTRAVEAKDPTTSGHGDRVRAVCRLVGQAMHLGASDRDVLDRSAALHDIGKIGVPDAVLCKPGALTRQEFALIQQHPEVGARILEPLPGMEEVRHCVLSHHEKWDGSGYPRGLRAEEVSLPGRVLILAEVFDALAHARSYKDPWPRERIQGFFREQSGRHFDPDLTDCFLKLTETDFEALVHPFEAAQSGGL